MGKIESRLKNYLEERKEVNEEIKRGTKKSASFEVGEEVKSIVEKNINKIKKAIIEVLTKEDYGMEKKEAQKVAGNVLTTLFRLEKDENNLANVVKKVTKKHIR